MPASFVLASFRPSTGTRPSHHSAARTNLVLLIRRTTPSRGYASGPSLIFTQHILEGPNLPGFGFL
jgi:hypothetical protein